MDDVWGRGGPGARRTRLRRVGVGIVLGAAALVAVACGGGRDDEGAGASPDGTGTTVAEEVAFGDLPSPCGPGSPSGAPDQGVDAATVTIGYGDDAGFQGSPGVNHQMSDAVEALIGWCNEQGGINGRTVEGTYYDAKVTEVGNVMTEACAQVFMLVGQGWGLAGSAEQTRLGCGLPTVPGVLGGSDVANAPLMVAPAPQPVDVMNVQGAAALAEAYPDAVKKVGMMVPDFPATTDYAQRVLGTFPSVGWEFPVDCRLTYPIRGVTDFRPFLQRLRDCGAEVVFTPDTAANFQNVLDAADLMDYEPIWFATSSLYEQTFADWNQSGLADRVYFANAFVPLEDATPGSANVAYLDIVEANGGDVSYTGQQAASAFLLWATAADACGDELTRACVVEQLRSIHDWTAGGLSSPQDPGANLPGECGALMRVDGTTFVQVTPAEPGTFACDPSYVVEVAPPIDAAAALLLDDDRVSRKHGGP